MAMAGLGLAGVLVQVFSDLGIWSFDREGPAAGPDNDSSRERLFGFGCALVASFFFLPLYVVFSRIPNYVFTVSDLFWLSVFVSVCILPFFFGGLILSDAYHRFPHRVNRIYTVDLVGAAGGTLAAFFLLRITGAFSSILFSAIAAGLALYFIAGSSPRKRLQAGVLLVVAVCFFLIQGFYPVLEFPHPSRKSGVTRFEKWSEMGLTTVARFSTFAGDGISKKEGLMDPHVFKFISHDYNSSTMAVNPALARKEISKIKSQISSFPFQFMRSPHVLILGAGGGKEVYSALAAGVKRVTAVEFNRVIVDDIMLGELLDFSGGLYKNEKVEVVVDEARSFLNRSSRKFDVIIPVMGSTPGLVAAGCYLFSTEYLQTNEAYQSYLDHLTSRGIFSFVCFFKEENFKRRLSSPYRVLATIKKALQKKGLDPARHMMVVGGAIASANNLYTHAVCVVFSPSPFSEADTLRARHTAENMGFELIYSPYQKKDLLISRFIESASLESFYEFSPVEIRPVNDDRPFYYDYRKGGADREGEEEEEYIHMIHSIVMIFAFYVMAIMLFPVIPGLQRKFSRSKGKSIPQSVAGNTRTWGKTVRGLGYFFCLGIGFIALELTLMQKAQFLLGIPAYGFFAVVFSFTLFMGLGSHMARRVNPSRWILLVVVVFLVIFSLSLFSAWGGVVKEVSGWMIESKVALVVVCFAPIGFLCGFPFVLGIRKHKDEGTTAWMWAINAATGTMGSVAVMLLWMEWGFFKTLLMGLGCYIFAIFLL